MFSVYVMTSADNKNVYVGSSKNPKYRFWRHMNLCKKNKHQHKIQALYNRIGKDDFEFDVLSEHATRAEALEHEQAWVDYYKAHPSVWNLLNLATENVSPAAHIAKLATARRKAVYVKWADGTEMTFPTGKAAAKHIGVSPTSTLHRWLNGKSTTFYKRGIDEVRYA